MRLFSDKRARVCFVAPCVFLFLSSCGVFQVALNPGSVKLGQELRQAFERGDTTTFASLLDKVSEQSPNAKRPGYVFSYYLETASSTGQADMVKILLDRGADFSHKGFPHGATPLLLAAQGGYPDTVQVLISHGASVQDTDYSGNTALMEAAKAGHIATIQVLISAGANPNHKTADGMTALSYAVQRKRHEAAYVLLKAGADPNVSSRRNSLSGWRQATPLSFAQEYGDKRMIELLEKAGAKE